jgi:hypothetical protein
MGDDESVAQQSINWPDISDKMNMLLSTDNTHGQL